MSDPDEIDLLAAEYVLGTLDADERRRTAERLATDAVLSDAVAAWQDRLSPLSEATQSIAPPAPVFDAIVARLFGARSVASPASVSDLRRRLLRWRAASAGFAALAACLAAWIGVQHVDNAQQQARFTAVLQHDPNAPAMMLEVDLATRRLTVRPLAATTPVGKSFELWLIDAAAGPPRSLGLVPATAGREASLAQFDSSVITEATYAVTVEPAGGSPNGQPTSAPILTGRLVRTSL